MITIARGRPGPGPTQASAISPEGAIPGIYIDAACVTHGYVRARDGVITTFDAPGAGTVMFQGTTPFSINPAGAIVGFYIDASSVNHGFLLEGE